MSEPAEVVLPFGGRSHILYRMYDSDRRLMYVGITVNVEGRFADHRSLKPWWSDVASIELEHFATRKAVEEAEREAIRTERPLFNVTHGYAPPRRFRASRSSREMKPRNFRASDKLWDAAQATAEAADENLAVVLRDFLAWYTRQPNARPPYRPPLPPRQS